MVSLTDITQRKNIEKELIEANKQLQFWQIMTQLTGVLNAQAYHQTCEKMINLAKVMMRHSLFSLSIQIISKTSMTLSDTMPEILFSKPHQIA